MTENNANEQENNLYFPLVITAEVRLHANITLGAKVRYSHYIPCVMSNSKVPIKLQDFV